MKILNILFESVLEPQGGLGVFVRDSMAELAKKHDVTVLGYDPMTLDHYKGMYKGFKLINCQNTNIHQKPKGAFHLLTLNDMFVENLLYHLKDQSFDVVHLHDSLLWPIAKYAAILFKAPIITHAHLSHALVHRGYPFYPQKKFEVTQEAHSYLMSHGILTCSKFYAGELQGHFMLPREFGVAYNGVDFEDLQKYKYHHALNASYGRGKKVVGFIGRMVPSKGIEFIVEAAKQLLDYHFLVISNIAPAVEKYLPLSKEIKRLEKEQDNVSWVRDLPSNDLKKWQIMASCDLAIVPSLHEPWGIVSDEWAALKVPKIVNKVGGLLEHNTINDSVMIDPDAGSLINAIKNHKFNSSMICNAYSEAKKLTWKRTASVVENKYKEVLSWAA